MEGAAQEARRRAQISKVTLRMVAFSCSRARDRRTIPSELPSRLGRAEIGLDDAAQLDGQRIAAAVDRLAGGDPDPALADAVFLDIGLLFAIEPDAHAALQHGGVVMRAFRI